jgi:iron complex transport system permease protein
LDAYLETPPSPAAPGGARRRERLARRRAFGLAVAVGLPLALVLAVGVGPTRVAPSDVVRYVGVGVGRLFGLVAAQPPGSPVDPSETIVLLIRLPRALLAAAAGASLGLAGATYQAVFRNPLADPYILGASSGAALGAAAAILLGAGGGVLARLGLPVAAFAGALAAVAVAYALARRAGGVSAMSLLLAGVVVSSWLSSLLSMLIYFSGRFLAQIVFWLMGGFGGSTWRGLLTSLPYMVAGAALVVGRTRDLNALSLGDDSAIGLGVDVERSRRQLIACATLLTAAAVAVSGPVGFVGLMVPHLVRLALGADHWRLLPGAAAAGALLMVAADTLARTALAPSELPVGIVTALLGGPFFLWLLAKRRRYGPGGGP